MENTDFRIENIDKEVQVIADNPSEVTYYPANTDFFIENIDANVISIAHSLNIEASEVTFRPANTDFFIENIDNNVKEIAESLELTPIEVTVRPANTDFFIENIDANLIAIAEELGLTPYEVTEQKPNTDFFIINIDKNVTLIKGSTNVITVSGDYINVTVADGGKVLDYSVFGNATQNGTPTPDAPVSISTVTGEQTVEVVGKNLFDINTLNKGSITVTDGVASGTALQFHQAFGTDGIQPPIPNQQFTITVTAYTDGNASTAETTGLVVRVLYTDGTSGNLLAWNNSDTTASTKTGTTSNAKTLQAIRISYNNQGGNIWHLSNIQLELGSTATTYEPYQAQTKTVNLGKNLVYQTELPKTQTDVLATYQDGVFELSGTASANSNLYILPYTQSIVHLEAGESLTYYLERVGGTSKAYFVTYFVPDDGSAVDPNWQLTMAENENSKVLVKTATKAGSIKYAQFFIHKDYVYDVQVKVMVQKGNIANPTWAEYFTPIELAKIGDYQDYIWNDGGTWKIHKEIGKYTFSGNESFTKSAYTTATTWYMYWTTSALGIYGDNLGFCEFGGIGNRTIMNTQQNGVVFNVASPSEIVGTSFVQMLKSQVANWDENLTDAQKNTLVKNMVVDKSFYYALATATDTEITDETLLGQIEAFVGTELFEGVNNIALVPSGTNAQGSLSIKIDKY